MMLTWGLRKNVNTTLTAVITNKSKGKGTAKKGIRH
jgi:hypothetical protein